MDSSFRTRLLAGFVATLGVILFGATGYFFIGDGRWTWPDCLYMTVITVTTVGFGETLDGMAQMPRARGFTMLLLVFGTGALLYFASTITAFVVEGELKHVLVARRQRKRIRRMKDHFVVCGAGSTGRHIIQELLDTGRQVVAVDRDEDVLREFARSHPRAAFSYVTGDATDDEILAQVNLAGARGLAAALSGDKDNLYLVVAARQINPACRLIARAAELSHVEKLKRAGADSVVSPNFIGGMRIVSELVRPSVVRFLDEMLRDRSAVVRIEEVALPEGSRLDGQTLRSANLRGRFGMNVLAIKDGGGWVYNPAGDHVLRAPAVLVVCGTVEQVRELATAAGD